jgi:CHAT domain-containing protein
MDDEASESFLKNGLLGQYALLHLAAHALVDQAKPHRSAILLSPGSDDEDGLLQLREIAELSIDGGVVLLTGCRTASGVTLAGEGPLSLARSFFLAGATGVIGGLWPLRDDDTAEMMVRFAERLGGGSSVSDALSDAKRSMFEAGSPAAAWSGLVLIGDGGLVPVSGDAVTAPANRRIVLLVALLLGVTTLLVYRRARRGRGR